MTATGRIAFITGIAGQDGALLASFLRQKGYTVHGLIRWDSYPDPLDGLQRLEALDLVSDDIHLHTGDITDANNINALIKAIKPDEIYNLAALSQVHVSFCTPSSALAINAAGTLNILESVRILGFEQRVRIYQASSSEMFGSAPAPQNEETPFAPCSPYGAAKLAAFWLARTYRDAYGMHVCNGILFNHESPWRGEDFVTRKITRAVAAIEAGRQECVTLGNLDSLRDWGHARDYVRGMWMMLQRDKPDDYVLATGQAHSVREFAVRAFAQIGVTLGWQGKGVDEQGVDTRTGKIRIQIDPALFRPKEVHHLLGDASKAMGILDWRPEISFDALVAEMVNADRRLYSQDSWPWPMAS